MKSTDIEVLQVGKLIVPFQRERPMLVLWNLGPQAEPGSMLVRARFHKATGLWYASPYAEPGEPVACDPRENHQHGAVIFVPRVLQAGECLSVRKLSKGGTSGHADIVQLPANVNCPLEYEVRQIFKPDLRGQHDKA